MVKTASSRTSISEVYPRIGLRPPVQNGMVVRVIGMLPALHLNEQSEVPLYRQLYDQIRSAISSGSLPDGERLPATRELAGLLGLNRTTVSAAYDLLISEGLISGHVGRG